MSSGVRQRFDPEMAECGRSGHRQRRRNVELLCASSRPTQRHASVVLSLHQVPIAPATAGPLCPKGQLPSRSTLPRLNRIRSGGSTPARCALPRRQCCATTNFSSAAAWPPGQACQCREKQQRPGLRPTAVIKAQVPREVRSQCAAPIRGSRWRRYFDIFFFFAFFVAMAYFLLA
jgi:hypothetical protein